MRLSWPHRTHAKRIALGQILAKIQPGDSGPGVKDLQINLNEILGQGTVKPTGVYDDETAAAEEKAKAKGGIGNTSGGARDDKLLKEPALAAEPRTLVQIGTKKAYVTRDQYQELMSHASAAAVEARTLSLDPRTLNSRTAPIRQAHADLDQYIEETQLVGPKLAEYLTHLTNACIQTLKVCAAIQTGGASWGVHVGAAAGMGACENLLKEIDTASRASKTDVGGAIGNIVKGATVEAVVALIMKGKGTGTGDYLDDVTEAAVKKCRSNLLDACARKAANGAAQKLIEDGPKALPELKDISKAFSVDKLLDVGIEKMLTGKALDKGAEEGVKTAIEEAGPNVVKDFVDALKPKEGLSEGQVEKDIRKSILANPKIVKAAREAAKGK